MLKRMRRHCVMMHIKNEDGLTLISTLFIMVLIALLLPFLISLITAVSYETTYDTLSIQQFFVFLRDELFMAADYEIRTNELILNCLMVKRFMSCKSVIILYVVYLADMRFF